MRILILLDNKIINRKPEADVALERIKSDYKDATPVSWQYADSNFDNLVWEEYLPGFNGISRALIRKELSFIPKDKYDQIIYLVSPENWQAPGIGGWNLGSPILGFQVEIVKMYDNKPDWLYKTFAMEIAHSWNDLCMQELADNLLKDFDTFNFDNQVIHGLDPRYGVDQHDGTSFTDYNYSKPLSMVKDKIKKAYAQRLERYNSPRFVFNRNLYFGMNNRDVYELQRRFVKEGLANYYPTSYFGVKTLASAIAYQKKHKITPAAGFVGAITRAKLNFTPTSSVEPSAIQEEEFGHHHH